MSVARNIETIRRFYGAGPVDDDRERLPYFAPAAVWHVPGENPVSGPYRGVEEIQTDMAARMAPLDRWEFDIQDVMGNGDMVVATLRFRGTRRGREIESAGAHAFRLDERGQIVEAWGFTQKQADLDEFFRA
jgi:ketosteroid isomerase-like protein